MTWHEVISAPTSFNFYQDTGKPKGIGFLETLKINNTRNNMKSQIQNKENGRIGKLLITLNKVVRNQGTYFVYEHYVIIVSK